MDGRDSGAPQDNATRPAPVELVDAEDLERMKKLFGKEYSSHSLKHGAITFLLGLVAKGTLTLEEVARLAKHENVETTIRYGGNPEVVALALGTQRATVHT